MAAPLFEFSAEIVVTSRPRLYATHGKRALDICLVVLAAPVVLPVLALLLAAVALSGGRPVYSQMRVGRDGRLFRCWKVRTMIRDADAALQRLLASDPRLAVEWRETQKLSRDPRVTRLGALMRRSSLDELPQLWNVLTGDMSLVGPRPFMPDQQGLYDTGRGSGEYYRVRPGITGLWQVGRRNRSSFAERVVLDADYCRRQSLATDIAILARTVGAVLRATGI